MMSYITHDEIGELVRDRLKGKGYDTAFSNMIDAGIGEQPDCLGIDIYGNTILIEAKVSRSDFKADLKKLWRKEGCGIGKRRIYVTTEGLLGHEEIPYGWELWEVQNNKKNTIKVIKGLVEKKFYNKEISCWPITEKSYLNMTEDEYNYFSITDDTKIINVMMIKIFRRMKESGIEIDKFSKGNHLYKK